MYRVVFIVFGPNGGGTGGTFPVIIIVSADCFGGVPGFVVSTVVSQPA